MTRPMSCSDWDLSCQSGWEGLLPEMYTKSLSLMVNTSRDPDTLAFAFLGAWRSTCSLQHHLNHSTHQSL